MPGSPSARDLSATGQAFLCDNADATDAVRGVTQSVELNQTRPEPIVATAWSKAAGVSGSSGSDYAVYLDLTYQDNTPLWGQASAFAVGTHDWERRQVVVLPEKPVKRLAFHLLFRKHGGKAWFRDPELRVIHTPEGFADFDGVPIRPQGPAQEGFQIRDVAAGSDFVRIEREALGLKLQARRTPAGNGAEFCDVTLSESTGKTARQRSSTPCRSLHKGPCGARVRVVACPWRTLASTPMLCDSRWAQAGCRTIRWRP